LVPETPHYPKNRSVSLLLTRTAFVVPEHGGNGLKHGETDYIKMLSWILLIAMEVNKNFLNIISRLRYRETSSPLPHSYRLPRNLGK
jgi:hypothetical protein